MATTSTPAAKAALLALLRAAPGLSGIQVEWSHPGDKIAPESVFFGGTKLTQRHRSLGPAGDKSEDYTIELWVVVHAPGNDGQSTEQRAWDLAEVVESTIRATPALGLGPPDVLTITAEFAGIEQDGFIELEGRTAQLRCEVAVSARI